MSSTFVPTKACSMSSTFVPTKSFSVSVKFHGDRNTVGKMR